MKRIEVTWRDAMSSGSQQTWWTPKEAKDWGGDDIELKTVGYFVMEDKKNLVLAMSRTARAGGKVGGLWSIPIGSIIKRRRL